MATAQRKNRPKEQLDLLPEQGGWILDRLRQAFTPRRSRIKEDMELPDVKPAPPPDQLLLPMKYAPEGFRLQDDVHGKIRHVLLFYGDDEVVRKQLLVLYDSLMSKTDPEVRFTVAHMEGPDAGELKGLKDKFGDRVRLMPTDAQHSEWARDRVHVLTDGRLHSIIQGPDTLISNVGTLSRMEEKPDGVRWVFRKELDDEQTRKRAEQKKGDLRIAKTLQKSGLFAQTGANIRLPHFRGGDYVSDGELVLVGQLTLWETAVNRFLGHSVAVLRLLDRHRQTIPQEIRDSVNSYLEVEAGLEAVEPVFRKYLPGRRRDPASSVIAEIWSRLRKINDIQVGYSKSGENPTIRGLKREIIRKIKGVSGVGEVEVIPWGFQISDDADAYLALTGEKRALVGDVRPGTRSLKRLPIEKRIIPITEIDGKVVHAIDIAGSVIKANEPLALKLDGLADWLRGRGYEVSRAPYIQQAAIPDFDIQTPTVSYCNVLMEDYESPTGRVRRVWMPVYEDHPDLNEQAKKAWESQGYSVTPVHMLKHLSVLKGSLRCLTQVLEREQTTV